MGDVTHFNRHITSSKAFFLKTVDVLFLFLLSNLSLSLSLSLSHISLSLSYALFLSPTLNTLGTLRLYNDFRILVTHFSCFFPNSIFFFSKIIFLCRSACLLLSSSEFYNTSVSFLICCIFCVSELTCPVKQINFLAVSSKRWDILLVFDVFSPPPPPTSPSLSLSLSLPLHFNFYIDFRTVCLSQYERFLVLMLLLCFLSLNVDLSLSPSKKKTNKKTVWHAVKIVNPFTVTGRTHASQKRREAYIHVQP